jgi:hypothetical protein
VRQPKTEQTSKISAIRQKLKNADRRRHQVALLLLLQKMLEAMFYVAVSIHRRPIKNSFIVCRQRTEIYFNRWWRGQLQVSYSYFKILPCSPGYYLHLRQLLCYLLQADAGGIFFGCIGFRNDDVLLLKTERLENYAIAGQDWQGKKPLCLEMVPRFVPGT